VADRLTPQQQMAVDDRGGKLLVSAAAGSGKTKVLVDRLLKYILDPIDPANVDDFLIITYTKAAAVELRGKIANKLSEHIAADPTNRHLQRQVQRLYLTKISTVHAFCADILRQYAYKLDLSADFRVADENECIQLRQSAMNETLEAAYEKLNQDAELQVFLDTQGLGRSDRFIPLIVEQVYDSAKCHLDPIGWCDLCVANLDADRFASPENTIWGKHLMEALFLSLDHQIAAMNRCADSVAVLPGMEKPTALLKDTVNQLVHLRNSKTWDEIIARKNIDFGRLTFPKKFDDPCVTEPVKAVRKACKDALEKKLRAFADPSESVLADMEQTSYAAKGLMKLVFDFSDRYAAKKKKRRVLDFSDLEHFTLDLLLGKRRESPTQAADEISARFREIMVDEYQDSNKVQDAIFGALSRKKQNLFMVGDVKQSIYQFRLADPGIFLEKYNAYALAENALPGQGRKILLSNNFRSGSGVIHAVNDVFATCMTKEVGGLDYGVDESLREGIAHIPLDEPEIEFHAIDVREDTYAEEAAFVAKRIAQLLDGNHFVRNGDQLRPITASDIVILLRSPGSVGLDFQDALQAIGIRCASSGGADLLLTEEIGTLRSLLQVISNPRQDIPLIATLASPVFGFTAEDLALIRAEKKRVSFYDALSNSQDEKACTFLQLLNSLRRSAIMDSLAELLEKILELTKLDAIYAAMDNGDLRRKNLQAFYQLAVDFSGIGAGGLDLFLQHLDTLAERGLLQAAENAISDAVTIMSIHKSKGLEFPVVFLCGLSKRFNQESLRAQVLCHKELGLGLSCVDTKKRVRYPTISKSAIAAAMTAESISEEMRVLYVALTRPKDRLIMTYASDSLQKDLADISKRMELSDPYLMTADVSCPGQWLLYCALSRTEAGQLHALAGKPSCSKVGEPIWNICVTQAPQLCDEELKVNCLDGTQNAPICDLQRLRYLDVPYPHSAATITPSKQTATQKKGRLKDQEVHELAHETELQKRSWRSASFLEREKRGTDYGNAMHACMQFIRYDACGSFQGVCREIQRLIAEGFLSEEQASMVDAYRIEKFFATTVGKQLLHSENVLREYKFSIMEDASEYADNLEGEKVLLQGVVDCAIIEKDGITIIDFKTDFVTEETLQGTVERYTSQVQAYANALARIFEMPIKAKALYFFRLNQFAWI